MCTKHLLGTNFFEQETGYCGVASVKSILSMYGKPTDVEILFNDGTSPRSMLKALRTSGLQAKSKTISLLRLKPRSIAYYPEDDHYVTIEDVQEKLLINDPEKAGPEWVDRAYFVDK